MQDPYKVLGISPDATDEQVKAAYREMARKYHPDQYGDNPLSELAQEKMQEINEAYDAIIRMRREGRKGGSSRYEDIRNLISSGRWVDAETLLDGMSSAMRDAEWYFLKGSVLYHKGWLEDSYNHFTTACSMDPANPEYRAALNQMQHQRRTGSYRQQGPYYQDNRGCSGCDVCTGLLCADCCCECMGGDLIRCC